MENQTPRFALPQLAVAQAHKEVTHNEALARIDAMLHPAIEAVTSTPPSPGPQDEGKCWIVGAAASGIFSGKSGEIAYWTGASWRFISPVVGTRIWHIADRRLMFFLDQQWQSLQPINLPNGGGTIDAEARTALSQLVARLTASGILASA